MSYSGNHFHADDERILKSNPIIKFSKEHQRKNIDWSINSWFVEVQYLMHCSGTCLPWSQFDAYCVCFLGKWCDRRGHWFLKLLIIQIWICKGERKRALLTIEISTTGGKYRGSGDLCPLWGGRRVAVMLHKDKHSTYLVSLWILMYTQRKQSFNKWNRVDLFWPMGRN